MGLAKMSMCVLCQTPLTAKGCNKNCYISQQPNFEDMETCKY